MQFINAIHSFSRWREFVVKPGTVRGYERELMHCCLFLKNPEIEAITSGDIMDYLNGLRELGWNGNSFVVKCMALRKFFEYCRLQGYAVFDPALIPIPRKEFRIPRVVTEEAYRKLLSIIPQNNDARHIRNRAIIHFLWDTGARNGEIVALNMSDIQLDRMRAVIKTEKSRGRRPFREIFWTTETKEALARWLERRDRFELQDPGAVFISVCGTLVGRRFTIKGVGEMLRRYSNKAQLPIMNAHSFRHHLGHEIVTKGGSAADVMNILGHSTLASSTIYTMMVDAELEGRYRKILG